MKPWASVARTHSSILITARLATTGTIHITRNPTDPWLNVNILLLVRVLGMRPVDRVLEVSMEIGGG